MELPFEIIKNILNNLETIDLLDILTVCKSWYRPAYETLYSNIEIRSERSFRSFLYTIAHNELNFGNSVKILNLYPEDRSHYDNSRSISFTEFDVLARHCPALEELYFHDTRYWKYMNLLNWDTTWLHLKRIPPANYGFASFNVYCQLGKRVTDLEVGTFLQHSDLSTMLTQMTQLKELTLNRYTLDPINTDILNTIHAQSPQLEHLMLKTRFEGRKAALASVPPAALKSLSCYIYSPESPWFSLIQSYYTNVLVLSLYVLNVDQHNAARPEDEFFTELFGSVRLARSMIGSADFAQLSTQYHKSLVNLYSHTPIPRIDILFQSFYSIEQLNQLFSQLSQQPQRNVTFSLDFTYYDDMNDFSHLEAMNERNLYISTTKHDTTQHHAIQYHSAIPAEQDEMQIIHQLPATNHLTELILTRKIVSEHQRCKIYLDEILYKLTKLQKLSVGCDRQDHCVAYSISSLDFTKRNHTSLTHLTFQYVRIHPCVFTFVFQNCHRLQELSIVECDVGEETLLALEYFCMKQNISLLYIK